MKELELIRRKGTTGSATKVLDDGTCILSASDIMDGVPAVSVYERLAGAPDASWLDGLSAGGSPVTLTVSSTEAAVLVEYDIVGRGEVSHAAVRIWPIHEATLLTVKQTGLSLAVHEDYQAFWSESFFKALRRSLL